MKRVIVHTLCKVYGIQHLDFVRSHYHSAIFITQDFTVLIFLRRSSCQHFTTFHDRPLWIGDHKAHIIRHLHKLRFHIKSGLTASGTTNYNDILVSGILRFLRSAVHGQAFCLCQQDIILKNRINKRSYILFISPSGRSILLSLTKLLSILSLEIYHCPYANCCDCSRNQTFQLHAWQQLLKS